MPDGRSVTLNRNQRLELLIDMKYMKQIRFSVPVLLLAICTLLLASASQSAIAAEAKSSKPSGATSAASGRLVIKRSPLLGLNVSINLTIDGKLAGTLVRGEIYAKPIAPGRHVLIASYSGSGEEWRGTLDVRPGETYSYSASYNVNKLVLTPLNGAR